MQWLTQDEIANNKYRTTRECKEKDIDRQLLCASIIITFAIGAYYINYFTVTASHDGSK